MRRLKTAAEHERLLATAPLAKTAHFVLHSVANDMPASPKASLLVAKRLAKRSVTRHLMRRQLDGLLLQRNQELAGKDHLVRLFRSFDAQQFPSAASPQLKLQVRAELNQLFDQALANRG